MVEGLTELAGRRLQAPEVEGLLVAARGGGPGPQEPAWLLRVGVNPDATAQLVEQAGGAALQMELGAGSGLGLAWGEASIPAATVQGLRASCQERGGYLTVLRQPSRAGAELEAWRDAPSKALIEAVKQIGRAHV